MNAIRLLAFAASLPVLCAQTLLHDAAPAIDPAVSADGRSLAFASNRNNSAFLHLWVRPLSGGEPRQITTGSNDDQEPAFSPDGRMLAYRSEARGGAIYLVSVAGGKPRLFAAGGRRPRFSPDGTRIAYWTGSGAKSALFVAEVATRQAHPIHSGFHSAKDPVWSPDGKSLLFAGCKDASAESCDWWVSPADGGEATGASVLRHLRLLKLEGLPSPDLWLAKGNTVVFTAKSGENTRLWALRLSQDAKADTAPRRVTAGQNDERMAAAAPDGRILFVSRSQNIDIWSLPLAADSATVKGSLKRLTDDPSMDQRPSLSRDGKRIAWETSRGGNFEVWVKDLTSGKERGITSGPLREHMPALSPDGSKLVYDAHDGEKVTIFQSAFEGGDLVRIREENIGQGSFQWVANRDAVLYFHREPPGSVGLMDLATKQRTVLLRHPKLNLSLADARLSPDGKWIAFPVPFAAHRSRLAVARVSGTVIDNENNWTYVMPESINTSQPEWSPDGKRLYFLSDQLERWGVWSIPLSTEGKPAGPPKLVLDLPGTRLSIAELRPRDIGLAIAADKLALAVAEYSGAIWSTQP